MLNLRVLYQFANFTLLQGKYAVPPKPEKLRFVDYIRKFENLTPHGFYRKLDFDKREQI